MLNNMLNNCKLGLKMPKMGVDKILWTLKKMGLPQVMENKRLVE